MSAPGLNPQKTRRMLVRGVLVVVYVGFMALAFYLGKGHTILLDNKDDGSVKAFENVSVSVDGEEPIEFMSGDRDMTKVRAQRHTIKININGKIVEKKINVPVGMEMALVSIPKLVAGVEPYVTPFVPMDQPAPAEDASAGNSTEFTSPATAPATPAANAPAPAPAP